MLAHALFPQIPKGLLLFDSEKCHIFILPVLVLTGCKFSVTQMLRSSAQIEGNRIRRELWAKKNAWDSEPA